MWKWINFLFLRIFDCHFFFVRERGRKGRCLACCVTMSHYLISNHLLLFSFSVCFWHRTNNFISIRVDNRRAIRSERRNRESNDKLKNCHRNNRSLSFARQPFVRGMSRVWQRKIKINSGFHTVIICRYKIYSINNAIPRFEWQKSK